jgi:hypothetical protein
VPFPAEYGGAIDCWNRLQALKSAGLRFHLHCFVYKSFTPHPALDTVAEVVRYYPRPFRPVLIAGELPYIISSRMNRELLKSLSHDKSPVWFEGIHTTGFSTALTGRKQFLRSHNIEHEYYAELSANATGMRSWIYDRESRKLETYEKATAGRFDHIFAISPHDCNWFHRHGAKVSWLAPFHGCNQLNVATGRGDYILYQGDLSLGINQEALLHLLNQLAPEYPWPVVVAGRSGSRIFEEKLRGFPNLSREADVSHERMEFLIRNAHIVVIHTLHRSGMKIKLFPALFNARWIAATKEAMTQSHLDAAMVEYSAIHARAALDSLWTRSFLETDLANRRAILDEHPSDARKATEIIRYLS